MPDKVSRASVLWHQDIDDCVFYAMALRKALEGFSRGIEENAPPRLGALAPRMPVQWRCALHRAKEAGETPEQAVAGALHAACDIVATCRFPATPVIVREGAATS